MIAPWLQPPNFVGAMAAGAQAGLAQRAQAANEMEASARLRATYDQMAAMQQREQMEMAQRAAIEGARLRQQLNEAGAMEQWRNQQGERWTADRAERERHNRALEQLRASEFERQNAPVGDFKPEAVEVWPGSNMWMVREPNSTRWQLVDRNKKEDKPKDLTPGQAADLIKSLPQVRLSLSNTNNPTYGLANQLFGIVTNSLSQAQPPVQAPAQPVPAATNAPPVAITNAPQPAPMAPVSPSEPVPPVPERIPGKAYKLPKGVFVWTGTGWLPQ